MGATLHGRQTHLATVGPSVIPSVVKSGAWPLLHAAFSSSTCPPQRCTSLTENASKLAQYAWIRNGRDSVLEKLNKKKQNRGIRMYLERAAALAVARDRG
jgi:hypothetical protein